MAKLLIRANEIRRMDVVTLREKLEELRRKYEVRSTAEDRQLYYNTYVAVTDEIARRQASTKYRPLLFKKSSVYRLSADELREKLAELTATPMSGEDGEAVVNSIKVIKDEMQRRRDHDKKWYDKRKAELTGLRRRVTASPRVDACSTA